MIRRIIILLLLSAAVTTGRNADTKRIVEGDLLTRVYSQLGTPVMEYPLDGTLILEYAHCTIVSSNGTVISAEYTQEAQAEAAADQPEEEEDAPPTIDEIKDAAMTGDAESQYLLAYCYQFGKAIEQDYSKAIAWYTKAAMQGHMASQHNLGYLYMRGRGVEQDYAESYMWALLAAEKGNNTLLSALDLRLTDEEKQAGIMRAEHMRLQMQVLKSE